MNLILFFSCSVCWLNSDSVPVPVPVLIKLSPFMVSCRCADGAVGEKVRLKAREKGVEKGVLEMRAHSPSLCARRSLGDIGRSFWDTGGSGGAERMPVIVTYMVNNLGGH